MTYSGWVNSRTEYEATRTPFFISNDICGRGSSIGKKKTLRGCKMATAGTARTPDILFLNYKVEGFISRIINVA